MSIRPRATESKYRPEFEQIYFTNKGRPGSGNMGESSYGTGQKAKWATTKPVSWFATEIPDLWPSSLSDEHCCIYRVPNQLRRVNPYAYTPQMLLISPLHHSKKAQALELSKTDSRYLDYLNMEIHKKRYLNGFANMYGDQTIDMFKKLIEREKLIRESYSESTDWIKSQEFVEMMLLNSMFILKFFIRIGNRNINKKGDILFEEPCLVTTIFEDLMLLENQLPFVLLTRLYELFIIVLEYTEMLCDLTFRVFGLQ
ncbi:hypothetical protein V5N11_032658 [Cardamine amara subsp. amara]|uniref:Uncharacterized protein n=1 Tax=Cardamine amara subsp. amara TaxID=228776 RepID=A0ABD1AY49_CARAN